MAKADYIRCDVCDCKVVYDGYDQIAEALEKLGLENMQTLCDEHRKGKSPAWIDFSMTAKAPVI